MKQLTCEMCGSTDLMKQDGVFVCQSCGTKYSVEEAKKMMVEGNVTNNIDANVVNIITASSVSRSDGESSFSRWARWLSSSMFSYSPR